MGAEWIQDVRGADVGRIAELLGLSIKGWGGRTLTPCPACHEVRRGKADKRGPVGMTRARTGWRCHRCEAGGDAVALVAWAVNGQAHRDLSGEGWRGVRAWFADHGLCDPEEGDDHRPRPPRRRLPTPPPVTLLRPPYAQLVGLLRASVGPREVPAVRGWLLQRGIALAEGLEDRRHSPILALPAGAVCPPWAFIGERPWAEAGYRALVPLWDGAGACRSVRARCVVEGQTVKELAPRGFDAGGLVMADPRARALLRREAEGPPWDGRVVVVEGVPDFLTWAGRAALDAEGPAVFGIANGAWTPEHAQAIPPGAPVYLRTHHDKDGERYAAEIGATLPHCPLFRSQPYAG